LTHFRKLKQVNAMRKRSRRIDKLRLPYKLVAITDNLAGTTLPAETFTTLQTAGNLEVLRGVSFTPRTGK
jgi:hypothetical protein